MVPFVWLFTFFWLFVGGSPYDDSCKWWIGVAGCSVLLVQSVVWLGLFRLNIYFDLYFLDFLNDFGCVSEG